MTHAADERNYHVFYELLKGLRPEEKERYGLTAADNYFYLNQVYLRQIENKKKKPRRPRRILWKSRARASTLKQQNRRYENLAVHFCVTIKN